MIWKFQVFNISSVEIRSEEIDCVDVTSLKKEIDLTGKNILLVKDENIANITQKYHCVKSFTTKKHYPQKVTIFLNKRSPLARVLKLPNDSSFNLASLTSSPSSQTALINWTFPKVLEKSYLVVDDTGYIFTKTEATDSAIIFTPEGDLKLGLQLNFDKFSKIAVIIDKLNELRFDTAYINPAIKIADGYCLVKLNGFSLAFSLQKDIFGQLASLQLILQKAKIDGNKIETIDLRFERPVVIYGKR